MLALRQAHSKCTLSACRGVFSKQTFPGLPLCPRHRGTWPPPGSLCTPTPSSQLIGSS